MPKVICIQVHAHVMPPTIGREYLVAVPKGAKFLSLCRDDWGSVSLRVIGEEEAPGEVWAILFTYDSGGVEEGWEYLASLQIAGFQIHGFLVARKEIEPDEHSE